MTDPSRPKDKAGMAEAMRWMARASLISSEMLFLGFVGHWLDRRSGTSWMAPVGFGLGLILGVRQMLLWAKELK